MFAQANGNNDFQKISWIQSEEEDIKETDEARERERGRGLSAWQKASGASINFAESNRSQKKMEKILQPHASNQRHHHIVARHFLEQKLMKKRE